MLRCFRTMYFNEVVSHTMALTCSLSLRDRIQCIVCCVWLSEIERDCVREKEGRRRKDVGSWEWWWTGGTEPRFRSSLISWMIFYIRRFNRLAVNRDRFSPASVFTLSAISFILGGSYVFDRAYSVPLLISLQCKYHATNRQAKIAFPFKILLLVTACLILRYPIVL